MTEVIGVRFKKVGKVYYFDPCGIKVEKDAPVVVETARGLEYGEVAMANTQVDDGKIVQPLKKLIRPATPADQKTVEQNLQFEKDAFRIGEEKIAKHKLDMKLISVEYTFDRSKILFYFSADGRVDFRELVKDLASVFRTRIELRQIGVRDEAKMIGGLGVCGCPLCCTTFLKDFQPVSINMAKDQGLSLNPSKISGTCGRLMCCLKYENDAYQEMLRETPPNESLVDTPYGRGTVTSSSLLRGTCCVRLNNNPDAPVTVSCRECSILRKGRDKGEALELPPEPETRAPVSQRSPLTDTLSDDRPEGDAGQEHKPQKNRRPRQGGRPQERKDAPREESQQREQREGQNRPPKDKQKSFRPRPKQKQPASGEERAAASQGQASGPAGQGQGQGGNPGRRRHRGGRKNGKPQPKTEE